MKKLLSRIPACFISAVLAISLIPSVAVAQELAPASSPVLQTSSQMLVKPGIDHDWNCSYDDSLASAVAAGKISFDPGRSVLTLNNVTVTTNLSNKTLLWVGQSGQKTKTLTVQLIGNNVIKNTGSSNVGNFLNTSNAMKFIGSGSLTVDNFQAICSYNNIDLNSGIYNFINGPSDGCIETQGAISLAKSVRMTCKAKSGNAIDAGSMTNSYTSLVAVNGLLPQGAEFATSNAVYQTFASLDGYNDQFVLGSSYYEDQPCVALKKWLSGKTVNIKGKLIKLAGANYRLASIETNAFNNKAGKAVKKVVLHPTYPIQLKKYAFNGMKNLTSVYLYPSDESSPFLMDYFTLGAGGSPRQSVLWKALGKSRDFSSKAFTGAGKASGKKLKVYIMPHNKMKVKNVKKTFKVGCATSTSNLKKYLRKAGLSKNAKVIVPKKTKAFGVITKSELKKSDFVIDYFL